MLPTKRPEAHYRVIHIYSAKPRLNKTVLRRCLKDVVVNRWSLMSAGRLFHTRGVATANARSPNLLRVRGTYRSPLSAVRNEARDGRSVTGLIRSAMYCGACPTSALWTSRHSLKSIVACDCGCGKPFPWHSMLKMSIKHNVNICVHHQQLR